MSEADEKKQSIINRLIGLIPKGYEGTKILMAALFGVTIVFLMVIYFHLKCRGITDGSLLCWSIYKTPPWILLAPIATAPALLLLWYWRTRHRLADIEKGKADIEKGKADIENANRRLITERFSKAIDHLGHENEVTNLGAIYELEAISRESQADHWAVVETLCAFIRKKRPRPEPDKKPAETEKEDEKKAEKIPRMPTDIQAALSVLGRRKNLKTETIDQTIDLTRTDLRGADLNGAHFERAELIKANLQAAILQGAKLQGAKLQGAILQGAKLQFAHLENADLTRAHLEDAILEDAHLEGANLEIAHLENANLRDANLEEAKLGWAHLDGADLYEAHLEGAILQGANLTGANLEGAKLVMANLNEANLQRATLKGADLRWANFHNANLEGAILTGAKYVLGETTFPEGFDPTDINHGLIPVDWGGDPIKPEPEAPEAEKPGQPPDEDKDSEG